MLTSGIILFLAGLVSTIVGIALNVSPEARSERLAEVGPGLFGSSHPGTVWLLAGIAVLIGGGVLAYFAIRKKIDERKAKAEQERLETLKMHEDAANHAKTRKYEEVKEPEEQAPAEEEKAEE